MGVRLALLTRPGLSPSCPRRACPRESVGRASRLVAVGLPNQRLDSRFRGNDEARPFQRPLLGAFGERKLTYDLVSKSTELILKEDAHGR